MEGGSNGDGIMQMSVQAIFSYFADASRAGTSYTMRASYLEIHNEKCLDMLADGGPVGVRLLDSLTGVVQTSPPLTHYEITDASGLLRCLDAGSRHRHVGQTRANDQSSRSHTVLQLQLESRQSSDAFMRRSLLNLVDLAGSESAKNTCAVGERRIEGSNINRSLLALSQVVSALSDNSRTAVRPSFRDSKLTRVIQQSIGGNSRTALICTVSTADLHYHESKRTLEFALRAKSIKNQVSANLVKLSSGSRSARGSQEMRTLKDRNEYLQTQLAQLRKQLAPGAQEAAPRSEAPSQKRPPTPRRRPSLTDMTNMQENRAVNQLENALAEKRQQRRLQSAR